MERFTLHPIRDNEAFNLYKTHEATFWTANEINFSDDKQAFGKLQKKEQTLITKILSFFSSADFLVGINLNRYFLNNPMNTMEVDFFYAFQGMMENIHSETYSLMITSLISDDTLRNQLFNASQHYPFVKMKIDWLKKWIDNDRASYHQRLFAFALVEGVLFSSSFSSIMFFKNRGVAMNGLIQSNELICRDEYLHMSFSIFLFNRHNTKSNRISQEEVERIVSEACEIEKSFARDLLEDPVPGLSLENMEKYIEYLCNTILQACGYERMYKNSYLNPFNFMKVGYVIGTKTNFFEKRETSYMLANNDAMDNNIDFNVEF